MDGPKAAFISTSEPEDICPFYLLNITPFSFIDMFKKPQGLLTYHCHRIKPRKETVSFIEAVQMSTFE
jgi:hypothetical protein